MSRKSKQRLQNQPVATKLYLFVVVDPRTNQRVTVAAPVYYQLIRRGWTQKTGLVNGRDGETGRLTEERTALLVDRLSFRSLQPSREGNLCFKSLLAVLGVSIESSWRAVERAWTLAGFPYSDCPQTLDEQAAVFKARQAAINAEAVLWGIPEPGPIRTGAYWSPDEAELAIAERQGAGK